MFGQHLWMNDVRQREKRLLREAEGDRLANECWRGRLADNSLYLALREAAAVFRARITADMLAGTQSGRPQHSHRAASEEVSPVVAEAEKIARSYAECSSAPGESRRNAH